MAIFNMFNCFISDLALGKHVLDADGHHLKLYLSNVAPSSATHTVKADIAEIADQNGYAAGGEDIQNDFVVVGNVGTLSGIAVEWTAVNGSFGPFRYAILYNDDATGDPLIAWWDFGAIVTVLEGVTFPVDFNDIVLTISPA
jgi:hypothetical protein